jgi:uncharacterized protein YndB with AHSA1/START domain
MADNILSFTCVVQAPAAEVYRAFTASTAWREWLVDVAFATPRKGGRLYLGWNTGYFAAGEYTTAAPGKKVAFTWQGRGEPAATRVQATLKEKGGATTVVLTHSGLGRGKAWAKTAKAIATGWEIGLENLRSVLETGQDLRFTLRPMLGVTVSDENNAEHAAAWGLPIDYGVRLGSVVPGMGAEAAGLHGGDVVVSLGGKKVVGFGGLAVALQGRRAGQTVPVVYYRDGQKHTTPMTLSGRPIPPIPATAAELAEALHKQFAESDVQLAACFEGVSEAAANHRPAPDEWSAKEVLAHLLIGERDSHSYYIETLLDNDRQYDGGFDNSDLRTRAVAQAYPSCQAMLDELKRLEGEAVALAAGLPAAFVARPAVYWRTAYNWLQNPLHITEHLRQIRSAIAAARA